MSDSKKQQLADAKQIGRIKQAQAAAAFRAANQGGLIRPSAAQLNPSTVAAKLQTATGVSAPKRNTIFGLPAVPVIAAVGGVALILLIVRMRRK